MGLFGILCDIYNVLFFSLAMILNKNVHIMLPIECYT